MIVAAHGNVDAYCAEHGMVIGERFEGALEDYRGDCLVIVTDNCDSLNNYYYRKYKLRRRNVELISIHWSNEAVASFVEYLRERERLDRKKVYRGRPMFGRRRAFGKVVDDPEEMAVVRRIVAMRDAGATYKEITEAEDVRYPDGRRMGVSTIQVILKNREKYGL